MEDQWKRLLKIYNSNEKCIGFKVCFVILVIFLCPLTRCFSTNQNTTTTGCIIGRCPICHHYFGDGLHFCTGNAEWCLLESIKVRDQPYFAAKLVRVLMTHLSIRCNPEAVSTTPLISPGLSWKAASSNSFCMSPLPK